MNRLTGIQLCRYWATDVFSIFFNELSNMKVKESAMTIVAKMATE
jgi:hypothetical protein